MRLLLVEDDKMLSGTLRGRLNKEGFAVDLAENGVDARHLGSEEAYDLAILDLGLPGLGGLEVLRTWRSQSLDLPVLVLTARDAWQEKVDGLKAGADDYLTKPFHYEELLARLQALLRRSKGRPDPQLGARDFVLNEETQTIQFSDGRQTPLTGTEFRLLRYFILHPAKVLSKNELTDHVYAYDRDRDSNVIEVYVRRLREKIGVDLIQTRRGQGYVFREGA